MSHFFLNFKKQTEALLYVAFWERSSNSLLIEIL